jgi:hypothetical protein
MDRFAVNYSAEMDPLASVTPEELITAILVEFEKGIVRSYYTNYVRNIFRVYLYRDDYSNLRPFQERIREEAARALQEELNRLNRPRKGAPALPFQKKQRQKRYEPLGDWTIEFLTNEDDNAAENRLIVQSDGLIPQAPDLIAGEKTVRVGPSAPDENLSRTRRTGFAPGTSSNAMVYARLSYEDDSGSHEFDIVKDAIKVGRGGPDEWVDLKLLTSKDVSREHFQIRRDASTGKFFIKDLSKFGTSIDGARVPPSIRVVNGIETDDHVEIPLPSKATINLADMLPIRFKALKKK